jgi:hypothetical protein
MRRMVEYACVCMAALSIASCNSSDVVLPLEELPDLVEPECAASMWTGLDEPHVVNTTTAGYQRRSSAVVLTDGRIAVSWASEAQDGDAYGIFLTILDSNGTPLTEEIQANQYTTEDQDYPAMTALPNGAFVVAWQSGSYFYEELASPDGSGTGIYARIFNSDGIAQTDEFQINEHAFHDQLEVELATMGNGDFIAVWTSAREFQFSPGAFGTDGYLAIKRFNANGETVFAESTAQDNEIIGPINLITEPANGSIAALEGGRFVVVWQQVRLHPDVNQVGTPYPILVRARVFEGDGQPVSEVIEVSQQSNSESTNEYDPRVAALPGGGFAVAWTSTRPDGNGVMMRHYDGNGTPRADEYLAAPTSGRTSMTVLGVDLVTVPEFGVAVGTIVRNSSDSQTASFQTISAAGEPFGDASSFDFDGAGLQTFAMHRGDNGSLAAAYVVDAEEFADRDDVEVRIMACPAE